MKVWNYMVLAHLCVITRPSICKIFNLISIVTQISVIAKPLIQPHSFTGLSELHVFFQIKIKFCCIFLFRLTKICTEGLQQHVLQTIHYHFDIITVTPSSNIIDDSNVLPIYLPVPRDNNKRYYLPSVSTTSDLQSFFSRTVILENGTNHHNLSSTSLRHCSTKFHLE